MGKAFWLIVIWGIAYFLGWTIKRTQFFGEYFHINPLMTIVNGYKSKDGCGGLMWGCLQSFVYFILILITIYIINGPTSTENNIDTSDVPSVVAPASSETESIPTSPQIQESAEIVRGRLEPFVTAQGESAQIVMVDWQNTGSTTIRAVFADINAYDAEGNKLDSSAPDYCIYACADSSPGISPGETYTIPDGQGFVLANSPEIPGFSQASRVEVTITRVSSIGY